MFSFVFWADTLEYNGCYADLRGWAKGVGGGVNQQRSLVHINIPFQMRVVRSYRAAMFVLHVDAFEARVMFAPRSCAAKNRMESP